MTKPKVAVVSPSFSGNAVLRSELAQHYNPVFNTQRKLYAGDDIVSYIGDAAAAIIGREIVDESVIQNLSVNIIAKYGVGLDNLDLTALDQADIALGWIPGVNAPAVAAHTLGLMLSLLRNLHKTATALKQGQWVKQGGRDLSGCTVGIIGVGHCGKALVSLLAPFNCKILACDIINQDDYYRANQIESVNLHALLSRSDIISLHVPLTPDTHHLINAATLKLVKKTAYIINTARGSVIDTDALHACIQNRLIAGAALDVYETEPYTGSLIQHENVIGTPHTAGNSVEAVLAMGRAAIQSLDNFFFRRQS